MRGHDPAPPWRTRLDAVVWWHRATPAAAAALPEPLRGSRHVAVTVAALVRYHDTPVGPYDELLASPVLLRDGVRVAGHVAFIAVDSSESAEGGRVHWALPKVRASFAWSSDGRTPLVREAGEVEVAAGEGRGSWTVHLGVRRRFAPVVPVPLAGRCLQVRPDGTPLGFGVRGFGLAAPGRARIAVDGTPPWLLAGDHPAIVLQAARLRVGPSIVVPLPLWGSRTTKLWLRGAGRARRRPAARRG